MAAIPVWCSAKVAGLCAERPSGEENTPSRLKIHPFGRIGSIIGQAARKNAAWVHVRLPCDVG
jgi:hypothetical protein